jgi:anion-transporting  ArsA/GET3 family ATPase
VTIRSRFTLGLYGKKLTEGVHGAAEPWYSGTSHVPPVRLLDVLLERRILVCVGSGGVGKTTTAAALALAAARRGKKTLVLTIDPARRLANSLGLAQLGHEVQEVDRALVRTGAPSQTGELHAMMLDQKRAFDEVVAKHATDPAAVQRILANPVYAQISGSLAGAQEYAALAKLHDFDASGAWDLIIVDTPPTANALDFLDAPKKLTEAIDSPAIEWFRKLRGGGGGWSLVGKTGSFVLKRIAKFVGTKFIDDLSVFFTEFNDILGGFRTRAEETFALLRQPRVGFVLVCSPEPMAVAEALAFHARLVSAGMPFVGFVVNKVHPQRPLPAITPAAVEAALAADPAVAALGVTGTTRAMAAQAMLAAHAELEVLATADHAAMGRLAAAGGPSALLAQVPLLRDDVHDVGKLIGLERYLLAS